MKIAEPLNSTGNPGDGLGLAVGEAHRRYTNFINARGRWTGHLFQSRFASVAMGTVSRAVLRWSEAPPSGDPRRYGENGWMPGKT